VGCGGGAGSGEKEARKKRRRGGEREKGDGVDRQSARAIKWWWWRWRWWRRRDVNTWIGGGTCACERGGAERAGTHGALRAWCLHARMVLAFTRAACSCHELLQQHRWLVHGVITHTRTYHMCACACMYGDAARASGALAHLRPAVVGDREEHLRGQHDLLALLQHVGRRHFELAVLIGRRGVCLPAVRRPAVAAGLVGGGIDLPRRVRARNLRLDVGDLRREPRLVARAQRHVLRVHALHVELQADAHHSQHRHREGEPILDALAGRARGGGGGR
jgi:hypothetical protein